MRPPSAGFLLLIATVAATAAFLGWGSTQPDLDRVWWRLQEIQTGRIHQLEDEDLHLLRTTIADHPELAPAILDNRPAGILSAHTSGHLETETAYLLVQPGLEKAPDMVIDCRLPDGAYPADLVLSGPQVTEVIRIEKPGTISIPAPDEGLLELRGPGTGLQVRFPRSP